ncbi:MAG: hypothetical protein JSV84_17420 [Gemmatimonadota bacterium]|nr:MAG: hypothetical protein JSV84_17420 [Gemmatimonadota bacterium]
MLKKIEFSNEEIREIDTYCRCMDKSFPHDYFKAKRKGTQRFTSILRSYVYALSICSSETKLKPRTMGREVVKGKLKEFVSKKNCEIDTSLVKNVILNIMKEKNIIEAHGLWIPLQSVYSGDLISALNDALPKYSKPKELERFDRDEMIIKEAFSHIERIFKKEKIHRAKISERRFEALLKKYRKTEILRAFSNNVKKILQYYDQRKESEERSNFLREICSRPTLKSLTPEEIDRLAQYGYKFRIIEKGKKSERIVITKKRQR